MPIEISKGKWLTKTAHGRALFNIKGDGLHVQAVTDDGVKIITYDEKILSFEELLDLAARQKRMFT